MDFEIEGEDGVKVYTVYEVGPFKLAEVMLLFRVLWNGIQICRCEWPLLNIRVPGVWPGEQEVSELPFEAQYDGTWRQWRAFCCTTPDSVYLYTVISTVPDSYKKCNLLWVAKEDQEGPPISGPRTLMQELWGYRVRR